MIPDITEGVLPEAIGNRFHILKEGNDKLYHQIIGAHDQIDQLTACCIDLIKLSESNELKINKLESMVVRQNRDMRRMQVYIF